MCVSPPVADGRLPSRRTAGWLAILAAVPALSGCVAAIVPVLAAGAMGREVARGDGASDDGERTVRGAVSVDEGGFERAAAAVDIADEEGDGEIAAVLTTDRLPEPGTSIAAPPPTLTPAPGPSTPWRLLADYVLHQRETGGPGRSVVLAPLPDLIAPDFLPCADGPLAVLIDLDADGGDLSRPLDPASVTVATTRAALDLHTAGVRLLWVTDRPAAQAADVRQVLTRAGLYAEGDRLLASDGSRKQERRWAAARSQCVVAIMGDRRGDMDEFYDYLRRPEAARMLDRLWNAGWFLAPPPIATTKG